MRIGTYGPIIFEVGSKKVYTFGGLTRNTSITFEEQENAKDKPVLRKKADNADDISFEIYLDHDYVNIEKEMKTWEKIKSSGKAYYLIIGDKKEAENKLKITNLSISYDTIGPNGIKHRAKISITMKETWGKKESVVTPTTKKEKKKAAQRTRNVSKVSKK